VAGRSRTCAAPRFRRALYLLSFGHTDGRGWSRTSDLLLVRQVLNQAELLARAAPGQGVEPRSPRSERGVLPVRRSRIVALRPSPAQGDRRSANTSSARSAETERCCPCHSPTLRPWIAGRRLRVPRRGRPAWRSFGARALHACSKSAGKSTRYSSSVFFNATAREVFLSQAGPRFELDLFQAEHHPSLPIVFRLRKRRRRPAGSPSLGAAIQLLA